MGTFLGQKQCSTSQGSVKKPRRVAMIDYIKEEFDGKFVVGAEIGTFRGESAEYILNHLNIKMLHLIDPYNYEDPDYADLARPHLKDASKEAHERLTPFEDRVTWWRMTSDEAVTLLPKLDFVYIDGNHYYEYVKKDIYNYSKLVMSGGWVGGHDYALGDVYVNGERFLLEGEAIQIEVKPAVDEYIAEHGYYLFVAGDPAFPDWWFEKPLGFVINNK